MRRSARLALSTSEIYCTYSNVMEIRLKTNLLPDWRALSPTSSVHLSVNRHITTRNQDSRIHNQSVDGNHRSAVVEWQACHTSSTPSLMPSDAAGPTLADLSFHDRRTVLRLSSSDWTCIGDRRRSCNAYHLFLYISHSSKKVFNKNQSKPYTGICRTHLQKTKSIRHSIYKF